MDEKPNLLQMDDVHVHYADGVDALRGVSLTVANSERVGLIGPNGAGKTTLMLCIMNAIRFSGRITIDSIEVGKKTEHETRGRCGMVFQDAEDHLFMPTLLDDVAFGPLNQGCSPDEGQRRAMAAIAQVGLAGLEHRSAHHMSGGQKRAAALATVLSMQVRLLLLDEPGQSRRPIAPPPSGDPRKPDRGNAAGDSRSTPDCPSVQSRNPHGRRADCRQSSYRRSTRRHRTLK